MRFLADREKGKRLGRFEVDDAVVLGVGDADARVAEEGDQGAAAEGEVLHARSNGRRVRLVFGLAEKEEES